MIIERLYLENFKRFQNTAIDFTGGITGIVGTNGSGKSSLVEAIFFALYGVSDKSISSEYVVSSFSKDPCKVILDFSVGGEHYVVSRVFSKGKTVKHEAELVSHGEIRATGISQVDAEIRRILGMGPGDFRNTIYAAQKDLLTLLDLTPGKRKEWFLRALGLEYLKTGSDKILKDQIDQGTQRLATLQGQLAGLGPQNPAELESARTLLSEAQGKILTLTVDAEAMAKDRESVHTRLMDHDLRALHLAQNADKEEAARKEIAVLADRAKATEAQLSGLTVSDEDIRSLENTISGLSDSRKEIEVLREKKVLLDKLQIEKSAVIREQESIQTRIAKINVQLDACLTAITELENIRIKVCVGLGADPNKEIDEAVADYRDYITEKVANTKARIQANEEATKGLQQKLATMRATGPEGTCPICLQHLGDHFATVEKEYADRIAEAMVEGDDLAKELDTAVQDSQKIAALKPMLDRVRELRILLGHRETNEDEKAKLTRELLDIAKRARDLIEKIEAIEYREEDYDACRQRLQELETAQNKLQALTKAQADQAAMRAKVAEINVQISQKEKTIAEIRAAIAAEPVDLVEGQRLKHDLEKIDINLRTNAQSLGEAKERVRMATEQIARLEEAAKRTEDVEKQLIDLRVEMDVLKLTRSAIADYVLYVMQAVRVRIETEVSTIIAEITAGKYDRVVLDEDFNLLVRENDREYAVDRFSGGEQDDIAVALRIALSRYLAELHQVHESTLLIFDEIFGSQDEERRANLLTALRSQESRFPQIILISHITEIQGEFQNTLMVRGDGPISTVAVA